MFTFLKRSALQPETRAYMALNPSASGATIAALDSNIRAVKYSTGVSLTAVTLNLSTASGAYFLTRSSVDLRPYSLISGAQISVAATGVPATTAVFGGLSQGTGETVNGELFSSVDFTSGWSVTGGNIIDANSYESTPGNGGVYKAGFFTAGRLNKLVWSGSTTATGIEFHGLTVTDKRYVSGFGTGYFTVIAGYTSAYLRNVGAGVTDISGLSCKQVLTADLSGVQASALTNGGINPNSASYVLTITRP